MPLPSILPRNQQPPFLNHGNGILYIKINKKDINGNDNTSQLQELTNLRVKFQDIGINNYSIVNITEYQNYFLYQINRTDSTSSINDNIRNYRFSASAYTSSNIIIPDAISWSGSGLNVSEDNLLYFNTSSKIYNFGDTPNIKTIHFTGSVDFTTGMTGDFGLYQVLGSTSGGPFIPTAVTGGAFNSGTKIVTGSFTPLEGNNYIFRINNESGIGITASNIQWQFTQSFSPQSSSLLTVFEPNNIENFEFSDCDVLMNNVSENHIGRLFRRVLYDDDSIIPSNYQQIMSQSAELAEVKDYNYSYRSHTYPRYNGVKLTQQNENKWTLGDDGFGKTPSLQTLTDKFAVFDWVGNSNNEIRNNGGGIHLTELIDSEGNRIGLSPANDNLFTIEQIFKKGKTAILYYFTNNQIITSSIYDGGAQFDSLLAVSESFQLALYTGQITTVSYQPWFSLSGSLSETSVITASYGTGGNPSWTKMFTEGIGLNKYWISSSGMINFNEKLLPTKPYDIIRFFPTTSIDQYYTLQGATESNNIERIIISQSYSGSEFYFYLDSPITSSNFPSISNGQGFRIYRRIPNETFVYVHDYQPGNGLLIPGNYNPNLDYLQIAKKAGIL